MSVADGKLKECVIESRAGRLSLFLERPFLCTYGLYQSYVVTSNIALITQNREMGGICLLFEISYLIKEGKGSGFPTVHYSD